MGNMKIEPPIWDGEKTIIDLANEYIGHPQKEDDSIATTMCREAFIRGASAILPKYYEEKAKVTESIKDKNTMLSEAQEVLKRVAEQRDYLQDRVGLPNDDPEQLAIALEKQGYVGTLRKEVSVLNNDYEYVRKVITLQLGKK